MLWLLKTAFPYLVHFFGSMAESLYLYDECHTKVDLLKAKDSYDSYDAKVAKSLQKMVY